MKDAIRKALEGESSNIDLESKNKNEKKYSENEVKEMLKFTIWNSENNEGKTVDDVFDDAVKYGIGVKDTIEKALDEGNSDIDSVIEKMASIAYAKVIPALDLFENRLRGGSYLKIDKNTNRIVFLDKNNNVLALGNSFREMLIDFLWLETSDQFPDATKMV